MAKKLSQLYEISGSVEHIVYQNETNQYTVFQFASQDEDITVVGTFPYLSRGEELKVIGEWTHHQSFGQQFKAVSFERLRPKTASAILKYLSSGVIKGIGASTAAKIVERFGDDSLNIIENDPKTLTQIKGISLTKANSMSEEIKRIYGIRELMVYLGAFGVKPEEAVRAWKLYRTDAVELIKEDPYCLCNELIGISFSVADSIAMSMEKAPEYKGRVCAGIIYVLKHNANNGHSCIPAFKLVQTASKMLGVTGERIQEAIVFMCENMDLICANMLEEDYIFLPKYYKSEYYIAQKIDLLLKYPARSIVGIEEEINLVERQDGISYAQLQKEAIRSALSSGLLILTGGPGTGKTTTLNAIINILKRKGEKVLLTAPTGRAAKRMSELTGEEAKTVHRLLQVDWDESDNPIFIKNEGNPLECDAIIVDELSMIDISVMEGLVGAMPLGCRLIMVGDTDQLPSVGAGNILGDLILSSRIPTVKLTEIFRQSRESLIVMNSHRIVQGEFPDISKVDNDFFFMHKNSEETVISTVADLICERLPKRYSYNPTEDIQILCPSRKAGVGSENLNKCIRERINPSSENKKQAELMGTLFREGDKVMHIKNNYELEWLRMDGTYGQGIFNGDMGIIIDIDKHAGIIRVKIDDKIATYDFEQAGKELEHAYAVTIHKSQGNEFPCVIIPLYKGTDKLKYRNLLYTGITRAKEILIIVGDKEVVRTMVGNDKKTLRYTGLCHLMSNNI